MFTLVIFVALVAAVYAVQFEIRNLEIGDIWVGILGNSGKPNLEGGGFVLRARSTRTIYAPDDWAGRFWPRTWCDSNTQHCLTGDCGNRVECKGSAGAPPASLAEITLRGYGGNDFYDISLVDGFNIPVAIHPVGGKGDCRRISCTHRFDDCPDPLKIVHENYVIGCKSACVALNTDEHCCRGDFNSPQSCRRTSYSQFFKDRCPDAYSYAYDDGTSTFTCLAYRYVISFGI